MSATFDPVYLNGVYVRESGIPSIIHLGGGEKVYWWHEFTKAGFTELQLIMVIVRLKKEIKANRRKPAALRLSTLIGRLINFEEELQLAKEESLRFRPQPTPRDEILRAINKPSTTVNKPPATPAPILAKLLADLRGSVNEP